jgi:hypothetical protein
MNVFYVSFTETLLNCVEAQLHMKTITRLSDPLFTNMLRKVEDSKKLNNDVEMCPFC